MSGMGPIADVDPNKLAAHRAALPEALRGENDRPKPAPDPKLKPIRGSLLEELHDAAGRQREARRIELDVPGAFAGKMRVRYHGLPLEQLERYADLIGKGQTGPVSVNIDLLATCAEVVLAYDDETGEWIELHDEQGPIALEPRLARLLRLPEPAPGVEMSTDELIRGLFMPDENAVPLGTTATELSEWLQAKEGLDPGESLAEGGSSLSAEQSRSVSPRPR